MGYMYLEEKNELYSILFLFIVSLHKSTWMKKTSTLLLLAISFSTQYCICQQGVNSSGNTIRDNSFFLEYSVWEISINTISNSSNTITQGRWQPTLKIHNPTCQIINEAIIRFENPTSDIVRIVGNYDWITQYHVYAADGRLVKNASFYNNYIDLSNLASGIYFIRLFPGCDGNFKVLKVIKQTK